MMRMIWALRLTGWFNATKVSYMPKDQGKFDFSCHDPCLRALPVTWSLFALLFEVTSSETSASEDWLCKLTICSSLQGTVSVLSLFLEGTPVSQMVWAHVTDPTSPSRRLLGFLRVTEFGSGWLSSSEPAGFVKSESCLKRRSAGPPFEPSWFRALMMS